MDHLVIVDETTARLLAEARHQILEDLLKREEKEINKILQSQTDKRVKNHNDFHKFVRSL